MYAERRADFGRQLAITNNRINLVSNARLGVAVLFLVSVYFAFSEPLVLVATGVLSFVFAYLMQIHGKLFPEKIHLQNLVRINEQEAKSQEGQYGSLDNGADFIEPAHPYAHDLDIFGQGSLYQYINRCYTVNGRSAMADTLKHPRLSREEILQRQESIRDLSRRIDFRQHIQAAAMEADEQRGDFPQLKEWISQPSLFRSSLLKWVLWIIPALTIVALVATFFFPLAKTFLFGFIILQWIITGLHLKKVNAFHEYISRKKNILQKYSRLLLYLENENFEAPKLVKLSGQAREAHKHINRLADLVGSLDARNNSMTTLVVNSLLLYDLQFVWRLEQWKAENATNLLVWLDTITEIEVLNSFATYAWNHPSFVYGTISTDVSIAAIEMAHPLIQANERIGNDVTLGPSATIMIVTGANMAGKSTFLRTLGVNLVLAQNGAPVCASKFLFPLIRLRSGMRTADSLQDHQSYFYAELHRLKGIMDDLRGGEPLLILLDEILKGTNSNDKQAGSIALVRQLLPHPCIVIIATHDLALGDLEHEYPDRIQNHCFEAIIENDQLSFDYKLKKGVAEKMNASFLMKKMGIIPK